MRKKVFFCAALLFGMIIGISVGALAGVFFAGAPSVYGIKAVGFEGFR